MLLNPKILIPLTIILALGGIFLGYQSLTTFREAENIITWETASEVETIGFNILRSESLEDKPMQINEQLIPSSSDSLSESAYTYTDTNVRAGTTYYYYLDDIESNGANNRHGPIEIKAANQKWLETTLAGVMLLAAAMGGAQLARHKGKKAKNA